jgi:hypothetical protein
MKLLANISAKRPAPSKAKITTIVKIGDLALFPHFWQRQPPTLNELKIHTGSQKPQKQRVIKKCNK